MLRSRLALQIFGLVASSAMMLAGQDPGFGPLRGSVVDDQTGLPIGDAVIRLSRTGSSDVGPHDRAVTDETGAFELHPQGPAAPFRLDIDSPRHQPVRGHLQWPQHSAVSLRLIRYGRLAGRVTDLNGGNLVVVEDHQGVSNPRRHVTAIDSDGHFDLFPVRPGKVRLYVSTPRARDRGYRGYVSIGETVVRPVGVDAPLYTSVGSLIGSTVSGRVIDSPDTGRLTAGLWSLAAGLTSDRLWARLLPAAGEFVIPEVLPGSYELRVTEDIVGVRGDLEREGRSTFEAVAGSDVTLQVRISLPANDDTRQAPVGTGTLIGNILRPQLQPTTVLLMGVGQQTSADLRVFFLDGSGVFAFDGLEAGAYVLGAAGADESWAATLLQTRLGVEIKPGEVTRVSID